MHKFQCYFHDNSTKKQYFTVSANDKKTAIDKAFKKAKKKRKGRYNKLGCKIDTWYIIKLNIDKKIPGFPGIFFMQSIEK